MHPVEPGPCWCWSVGSLSALRRLPVSGSRLLSPEQTPPENSKRKRKETEEFVFLK